MTTTLTLPTPAAAPTAPLTGATSADQPAGADLFAAVFTAVADDQSRQAAPSFEQTATRAPNSDVASQPVRDDATATEAATQTPPGAAADELTRSRTLHSLTMTGPAKQTPPATDAEQTPAPTPAGAFPPQATDAALPEQPLEQTAAAPSAPATMAAEKKAASAETPQGPEAAVPAVAAATQRPPAADAPVTNSVSDEQMTTAAAAEPAPTPDDDTSDSDDDSHVAAPAHPTGHHVTELPAQPAPAPTILPAVQPQPAPTAAELAPSAEEEPAPTPVAGTTSARAADTQTAAPADIAPVPQTVAPHQLAMATPVAAPAAPTPVNAPARTVPADVAAAVRQQLTGPLVKVTEQGGEQILVVQVRPENLGPVTVHAHVRDNAVHVELFTPSDAGRDALTQVAADLRADLQQAHTGNTSLNVSSQTAPSADRDGKPRDGSSAEPRTGDRHPTGDTPGQDAQQQQPRGSNRLLDVLA